MIMRRDMIRATGELNYSSAHIRLRDLDKSKGKTETSVKSLIPCSHGGTTLVVKRGRGAHSNICTDKVTSIIVQLVCVNPNSSSPLARGLGQEHTSKVASTVKQAPTEDEVTPAMVPPTLER
ncbi:hypothetical protein B296_00015872 [Ensete ventricosum]|uniref:Uncharacterized protein n=1 Tax=Ensete ventricosum TaxID=4639 RepID=A0A427AWQ5_ENSVE|nr:hypothetical protein B296_00015872 [Ensete ventricosum]